MLAVPAMAVAEHEVGSRGSVGGLVDSKEVLDRSASAALGAGVERSNANRSRGLIVSGAAPFCGGALCLSRPRAL